MPDWRDEVCSALSFWIAKSGGAGQAERPVIVGRARPETERGWFAVDLRGSRADIDQVESLRLCGKEGPSGGDAHPVMETIREGSLVRLRVAGFVDLDDAYLWQFKQPMTHLIEKLRDGIAGLAEAGLAHDLAAARLAAAPAVGATISGFMPMQQIAYAACFAPGVRLIWGPPGTGKTRVLTEAISNLIAADKRILLVSATNIAVDNALIGVVARRRHAPGQLLRVGPPHHPEVAKHPEVCLPALVNTQLADVEAQRRSVEAQLLKLRDADDELAGIKVEIAGFDAQEYASILRLQAAEASIPSLAAALADREKIVHAQQEDSDRLQHELDTATGRVTELIPTRAAYAEIDRLERQLREETAASDDQSARALVDRHAANRIRDDLVSIRREGLLTRIRSRSKARRLQEQLSHAEDQATRAENQAHQAGELLSRRRATVTTHVQHLSNTLQCTPAELARADADQANATRQFAAAQKTVKRAAKDAETAKNALARAREEPTPTEKQRAMVAEADRRNLPTLALRAISLAKKIASGKAGRVRLEKEHANLQDRFERLRKDAEGDIIGRAQLVATTLARLRMTPAVMRGPYDVVLIDEVGAATLPEVLLAVSRATRTAVLLGDFMQLGAVIDPVLANANRPDVQRWLIPDVFDHCGIASAGDAQGNPGCVTLNIQHRFGPEIMGLANAIAYDGHLEAGPGVRAHADNDPEIVILNVDGLGEIAKVHATGAVSGWWPAGALLSRVIIDYHRARGEHAGVVTPYGHQVDATLEALRDREPADAHLTEVGTAHRFQGREFPIVVFDLVEDEYERRWMAAASRTTGSWERQGLRLFNVAVTRAQTRLYLIASGRRMQAAPTNSPLGYVTELVRAKRARIVPATQLLSPTASTSGVLGAFGKELAELLAEHIHVSEINDEHSFYEVFADHLASARRTLWIWSPWTASRVMSLLPALSAAVARGVKVILFVRDSGDSLQKKPEMQNYLNQVRAIVPTVIEVNVMHQKIVVIDEKTVLLGSLNTLSQARTREVMLTMRGEHFARKLLQHEHAEAFAKPPACGACQGRQLDLRRRKRSGEWYWRCYAPTCPKWSERGQTNWTQPVNLKPKTPTR